MENRSIAFWIIIIIVIAGIGYGIWTGFLNKGMLSITESAPFTVTLDEEVPVACQQNPCSFKIATGPHLIRVEKQGHLEMIKSIEVARGEETVVAAHLQKIVSVVKTQSIEVPALVANPFILKTSAEKQALVKKSTQGEDVIAYFARPLKNAKTYMVADASMVWVTDSDPLNNKGETIIYQIDVAKKTRHQLWQTSEKIVGMMPSGDGKFLAVVMPKSIELFDTQTRGHTSVSAAVESEKLVTWVDGEEKSGQAGEIFYVDSQQGVMYLRRATLENPLKPDTIQAWRSEEDVIERIWFEGGVSVVGSVLLKGKKDGYRVEL